MQAEAVSVLDYNCPTAACTSYKILAFSHIEDITYILKVYVSLYHISTLAQALERHVKPTAAASLAQRLLQKVRLAKKP